MEKLIRSTISAVLFFALSLYVIPSSFSAQKSPEFKTALGQMKIQKDTFKGITWYQDKSSPKYRNSNGFYLYCGTKKGANTTLRFVIQYYGEDWLFIEKYLFNVDGDTYEIDPSYGDVEKDNDSKVWEWLDITPDNSEVELLRKIIKSKKAVMRIEGSKYVKDVTISTMQKKALGRVLTVYSGLGGQ